MKKAVVIGAGNIGRGFIGQIFYKSGYTTTFVDVNETLVNLLNRMQSYTLHIVGTGSDALEYVENISAVYANNKDQVVDAIAAADLCATAVGAANLVHIAPLLAEALLKKAVSGTPVCNILVCENKIGANRLLADLVRDCVLPGAFERIEHNTGFIEVSIGRMVPPPDPAQPDPLLLRVEPYDTLPYDATCWRGPLAKLHGAVACSDFGLHIKQKLYLHNLGHAVAAYFGFIKGYRFIPDTIRDPLVFDVVKAALRESTAAILAEYPDRKDSLAAYTQDLLTRFSNQNLKDPVKRVAADPMRKLEPGDRLIGAMKNCETYGIPCPCIIAGISAALLYDCAEDPSSRRMQRELSLGLDSFLSKHCGLDVKTDSTILALKASYHALRTVAGLSETRQSED